MSGFDRSVCLFVCLSVWKTGFHLHAVCIEEADVGEVVRVVPVGQAQQQLPLHASQAVDLLVKVCFFSMVVLSYMVIPQIEHEVDRLIFEYIF